MSGKVWPSAWNQGFGMVAMRLGTAEAMRGAAPTKLGAAAMHCVLESRLTGRGWGAGIGQSPETGLVCESNRVPETGRTPGRRRAMQADATSRRRRS